MQGLAAQSRDWQGMQPVLPCSRPQDARQDTVLLPSFQNGERESGWSTACRRMGADVHIHLPHFVMHLPCEAAKGKQSSSPLLKIMVCMLENQGMQ